jgi:hypothetical protein
MNFNLLLLAAIIAFAQVSQAAPIEPQTLNKRSPAKKAEDKTPTKKAETVKKGPASVTVKVQPKTFFEISDPQPYEGERLKGKELEAHYRKIFHNPNLFL